MAIKKILMLGKHEKTLRTPSEPVKKVNREIKQLIQDLKDTLRENPGVGLAAVQIGVLKRVFIVRLGYYADDPMDDSDEPEEIIDESPVNDAEAIVDIEDEEGEEEEDENYAPPVAFVNPEIIEVGPEKLRGFDGCLSIPNMMGYTDREPYVKVRYLDENGKSAEIELTNWDARMFLHEYDHIQGILYLDRLNTLDDLYVLARGEDGKTVRVPYLKALNEAQRRTSTEAKKTTPKP